jgi:transposase
MVLGIVITPLDLSADEFRREAGKTKDAKQARRMLALALVLEGKSREEAATMAGMTRQTLCDWVHRYNEFGLDGLVNYKADGPVSRLNAEQKAKVIEWVEAGPDISIDKVVRWRCKDLSAKIKTEFSLDLHERTVGTVLAKAGYRRLSVRPRNPKADNAAEEAFKKTSRPR